MRTLIAALLCLFIAGCAGQPKIETQIVKVPVPTKRECPPDVCKPFMPSCPLPVFMPADGNAVTLDAKGQADLRCLIVDLKGWGDAMLAHEEAP
jgi:hypothetical protein